MIKQIKTYQVFSQRKTSSCQKIHGTMSSLKPQELSTVFQGSLLSWLLLQVFNINDWGDEPECIFIKFADDTNLVGQLAHLKAG